MADRLPDAPAPADAHVLGRIWDWTSQAVAPIDAAAIARAAATAPVSSGPLGRLRGLRPRHRHAPVVGRERGRRTTALVFALLTLLAALALIGSSLVFIAGQRATPSPEAVDSLGGFVTKEVEPGVLMIVSDGVRDLDWKVMDLPYGGFSSGVAVQSDGSVWLKQGMDVFRVGLEASDAIPIWSDLAADALSRHWTTVGGSPLWPAGSSVPGPVDPDKFRVGVGADDIVWVRTDRQRLYRYDPSANTIMEYDSTDGVPYMHAVLDAPGLFHVGRAGSLWVTGTQRRGFCDGVSRFDSVAWTKYLAGQCVYSMDSASDGSLWLLASAGTAEEIFGSTGSSTSLYRIHPEP